MPTKKIVSKKYHPASSKRLQRFSDQSLLTSLSQILVSIIPRFLILEVISKGLDTSVYSVKQTKGNIQVSSKIDGMREEAILLGIVFLRYSLFYLRQTWWTVVVEERLDSNTHGTVDVFPEWKAIGISINTYKSTCSTYLRPSSVRSGRAWLP